MVGITNADLRDRLTLAPGDKVSVRTAKEVVFTSKGTPIASLSKTGFYQIGRLRSRTLSDLLVTMWHIILAGMDDGLDEHKAKDSIIFPWNTGRMFKDYIASWKYARERRFRKSSIVGGNFAHRRFDIVFPIKNFLGRAREDEFYKYHIVELDLRKNIRQRGSYIYDLDEMSPGRSSRNMATANPVSLERVTNLLGARMTKKMFNLINQHTGAIPSLTGVQRIKVVRIRRGGATKLKEYRDKLRGYRHKYPKRKSPKGSKYDLSQRYKRHPPKGKTALSPYFNPYTKKRKKRR